MKKIEKFTIPLLILLIVITFNQNTKINELTNTIYGQSRHISSLQDSIHNIQGAVNNSLTNWERENRWLHSSKTIINSISDDTENMEVLVNWHFNELKHDEEIYLLVGEKTNVSEYTWEKLKVDAVGDLHFQKTLILPFRNDYKLDVIAESPEGRRLAEVGVVEFYSRLKERFQLYGHINILSGNKLQLFVDLFPDEYFYLYNHMQLSDGFISKLKVESIFAEVYLNGQLIDTFDLLEEIEKENHREIKRSLDGYPQGFMQLNKELEIEELSSGKIDVIVKIIDGLGEVYQFQIH